MKPSMPHKRDRGQVGIGTLIVFIAMVLVAAIAAGVLINTAGFLQSQSEQTGQQSSAQVSDRLQVVNTVGENISNLNGDDETQQIGIINMTVSKAPGANDIDLNTVTLQFVSDEKIVNLVANNSAVVDNAVEDDPNTTRDDVFHIDTVQDDDESIANSTVVNDAADRARITLSISNNSSLSGNYNGFNATAVGPLNESASASVQLTTQAGGETTVTITVPDSLTGKDAVEL
jgi:flagellin FlaB